MSDRYGRLQPIGGIACIALFPRHGKPITFESGEGRRNVETLMLSVFGTIKKPTVSNAVVENLRAQMG